MSDTRMLSGEELDEAKDYAENAIVEPRERKRLVGLLGHIDAQAKQLKTLNQERIRLKAKLRFSDTCLDGARRLRDEATTQLSAWHKMFGTTQLTHALAERDSTKRKFDELVMATQDIRRIVEKRDALVKRVAALEAEQERLDRVVHEEGDDAGTVDAALALLDAQAERIAALEKVVKVAWEIKHHGLTSVCRRREELISALEELAALDQKPKPKPLGYVAGPAPSAFPGW